VKRREDLMAVVESLGSCRPVRRRVPDSLGCRGFVRNASVWFGPAKRPVGKSGNRSLVPYSDIVEIEKKTMSRWVVVPVVTFVALLAVIGIFCAINPPPD
jgi:hypothetical protein